MTRLTRCMETDDGPGRHHMAAGRPPGHRHPIGAAGLAAMAALALAACSRGPANPVNPAAVSSPAAASTGPTPADAGQSSPAQPIAPLTGLPAASAADGTRPAVALAVLAAAKGGPPPPLFSYRRTGAGDPIATTGTWQAISVQLTIPGAAAQIWKYDSHTGRWSQSGGPAAQVANLVIQTVPYKPT